MSDYFIRTEDIRPEDVLSLFVETEKDRRLVEDLKSPHPVVLVGSRGVGKSFLLRVAQQELLASATKTGIVPVYVSFSSSPLLQSLNDVQFHAWMLTKICGAIGRAVSKAGLLVQIPNSMKVLAGTELIHGIENTPIEQIQTQLESVWRSGTASIDTSSVPELEDIKNALEDLVEQLSIKRFNLLIDEAAHIFLPRQQRLFFSLFRDLRSPFIVCKAAVYPGVTAYGSTFQPMHDAVMVSAERDVMSKDYVKNMREIVEKQADSNVLRLIEQNISNFSTLAYAATGNPRILLKTLAQSPRLTSSEVNQVIKDYYRTDAWSEHSILATKYRGHAALIDWGRNFIEQTVLPALKKRNDEKSEGESGSSAFFWIHRDAPQYVRQALQILTYTGIVTESAMGLKGTRSEIGTRYMVNLGCLFSMEAIPASSAPSVWHRFDIRRMAEYGQNHPAFATEIAIIPTLENDSVNQQALSDQLAKPVRELDLTDWQKETLEEIGLTTIRSVLQATEVDLQKAKYVGEVRSRRMRNAAMAAAYEYLSG
jgi:hypothetical protein